MKMTRIPSHPENEPFAIEQTEHDRQWFEDHPEEKAFIRRPFSVEASETALVIQERLVLMVVVELGSGARIRQPIFEGSLIYNDRGVFPAEELAMAINKPMAIPDWNFPEEVQAWVDMARKQKTITKQGGEQC